MSSGTRLCTTPAAEPPKIDRSLVAATDRIDGGAAPIHTLVPLGKCLSKNVPTMLDMKGYEN
jgi:hypothetical protein